MACLSSKTVLSVDIEIWSLSSLGPAMKFVHTRRHSQTQESIPFTLIWISGVSPSVVAIVSRWWWGVVSLVWHCCLASSYLVEPRALSPTVNHTDKLFWCWTGVLGVEGSYALVKFTWLRSELRICQWQLWAATDSPERWSLPVNSLVLVLAAYCLAKDHETYQKQVERH